MVYVDPYEEDPQPAHIRIYSFDGIFCGKTFADYFPSCVTNLNHCFLFSQSRLLLHYTKITLDLHCVLPSALWP